MKKRNLLTFIMIASMSISLISCSKENNDSNTAQVTKPPVIVNPVDVDEEKEKQEESYIKNVEFSEELAGFVYLGQEKMFEYEASDTISFMSCIREYQDVDNRKVYDYELRTTLRNGEENIKELTQIVDNEKIVDVNPLKSLITNKEALKLPIIEGNKWNQQVEIDNIEYTMNHEIVEIIPKQGDIHKRVIVKSIVTGIEGYNNNKYIEVAMYEETLGLIYSRISYPLDDIGIGYSITRAKKTDNGLGPIDLNDSYFLELME